MPKFIIFRKKTYCVLVEITWSLTHYSKINLKRKKGRDGRNLGIYLIAEESSLEYIEAGKHKDSLSNLKFHLASAILTSLF